jgi:antitoxin (DNA-binding transcriptional repressor) of toxin-antitoxin stability system
MLIAQPFWNKFDFMSEIVISVAEAAKDFLRLVELVESQGETRVLERDGKPIAKIVPFSRPAASCQELAALWENLSRLPPEEAEAFAQDLEDARATIPSLKSVWDSIWRMREFTPASGPNSSGAVK